jgi:hypothetical protein
MGGIVATYSGVAEVLEGAMGSGYVAEHGTYCRDALTHIGTKPLALTLLLGVGNHT